MGIFPECVAKVSRFTFGGLGVDPCSLDIAFAPANVRKRSQLSATVRNHSREVAMAVHMGSSAKGITLGGFQRRIASFRVAGVALLCSFLRGCVDLFPNA